MENSHLVRNATVSSRNVIKTSSSLAFQDVKFHKSIDAEFLESLDASTTRIIKVSNDIIHSIGEDEIDINVDNSFTGSNMNKVSNIIDVLFEKADMLFDEIKKPKTQKVTFLEDGVHDTNPSPKVVEKPQEKFKIKVDNTEMAPFKPKLNSKPNLLRSLADSGFESHPYSYEIDNQAYNDNILLQSTEIPPKPWESTSAIWVDKPEQIPELVNTLKQATELAIDLEHHDYRTYYGLVCLMQISNRDQDWIVDTLALRDDLQPLNEVFTDPKITKVFHGAFMDIIWLQRDLGLYIVSLFDTYHASKKLGFPRFSLAYLLETFAHFKTSKKYQLADWRIRPLSKPMLAYARSDTHFLLYIFDQLKNRLLETNRMLEVLYESRQVAKRRFEYSKFRPRKYDNLVATPVNSLDPCLAILSEFKINVHLKPVVKALYTWRDALARRLDESVRFIMPNHILASLAKLIEPVDAKKVFHVSSNEHIRNHAQEIAAIINDTLRISEESDWNLVDEIQDGETPKQQMTTDVITKQNKGIDHLRTINRELLQSNQVDLKSSVLFDNVQPLLGVSGHEKISLDRIQERKQIIHKEFEKYDKPHIEMLIQTPDIKLSKPKLEQASSELQEPKQSQELQESQTKQDLNEIITLRKPKIKHTRLIKQSNDEEFDYSQSDNLIKPQSKTSNPKKRKFDPYSKTSDGPRPARKTNNNQKGRSTTFKR